MTHKDITIYQIIYFLIKFSKVKNKALISLLFELNTDANSSF